MNIIIYALNTPLQINKLKDIFGEIILDPWIVRNFTMD